MAYNRSIRFSSPVGGTPNSLARRLANSFAPGARERGLEYFTDGRVVITRGTPSGVTARVRGHRPYNVALLYGDGVLSVECECPYFESSGACKHIWATLLAADQQTFLSQAAADSTVALAESGGDVTTPAPKRLDWRRHVEEIARPRSVSNAYLQQHQAPWPERRQILYWVDVPASKTTGEITLSLQSRDHRPDDTYTKPTTLRLKRSQIAQLPRVEDQDAISAISGGRQQYAFSMGYEYDGVPENLRLPAELARVAMPLVVKTGQCFLRLPQETNETELAALRWDDSGAWKMTLEIRRGSQGWVVLGTLRRGEERMELMEPVLIAGGFVFLPDRVAPLESNAPANWIAWLRGHGMLEAPEKDGDQLLGYLLTTPGLPAIEVPEELKYEEARGVPKPRLRFRGPGAREGTGTKLRATLSFDYDGKMFEERGGEKAYFDADHRRLVRRDAMAEREAAALLHETGMRRRERSAAEAGETWELTPSRLPSVVRTLTAAEWNVEADGKTFRAAAKFSLNVSSGVDWFELQGNVDYGGHSAGLPALLAAVRRGENAILLDDGSYGLIPEEWLERIAMVAGMGQAEDGSVRFRRSQAGLLEALLASQPEATWDTQFEKVREELRTFAGVHAAEQPAGFEGQLRDYQKEGLGWMGFLRRFSFGGCLADDMGTGKTAQVLALLEARREARAGKTQPSLVVVPRSLIFNWREEAARFTPRMSILDYTGPERDPEAIGRFDLVLTTYGTLRRDISRLREIVFDYAVLDEAQAVKNSGSEGAKAVRLIQASHKLALSGTPVENHLGELWSLFEFLNPGMLGAASVFKMAGGVARNPDEESRRLLAHAVRPFILRRTKEQVARELPPRTEQTIYCELGPEQRALYDELRDHYRSSLFSRIDKDGLAKSKIMVLEALLRLRQAACHPGLIDADRKEEQSAKLEALIEQIREVIESGHKALVFSQFTSLLAIVRRRLDQIGIVYEYLDGKTRDRQARVERFQNDAACPLFLISLKAGGLGLNLTAADYVFLMDPWWNPAVEAQAIDRAHRIGQVRQVSAYRLIARGTVEEKVLELQRTKRDLAAAIIGESNSVIRDLRREDLELLLS